jgi:hypothetical protein
VMRIAATKIQQDSVTNVIEREIFIVGLPEKCVLVYRRYASAGRRRDWT